MSEEKKFYVQRNGKTQGPFSTTKLGPSAKSGKLKATDRISTSEGGPWKAIADVPALAKMLPQPSVPDGTDGPLEKSSNLDSVQHPDDAYGDDAYGDDAYGDDAYELPPLPKKKRAPEANKESSTKNTSQREAVDIDARKLMNCPDCNATVSRRAPSCPQCGAPLGSRAAQGFTAGAAALFSSIKNKVEESDQVAKAVGEGRNLASKAKGKIEKSEHVAKAVSQTKTVASSAVGQAAELKQSTIEQFEQGGVADAAKHVLSSLASPRFRILGTAVGVALLLVVYFTFLSGGGPLPVGLDYNAFAAELDGTWVTRSHTKTNPDGSVMKTSDMFTGRSSRNINSRMPPDVYDRQ
jgi:hypothetical protein